MTGVYFFVYSLGSSPERGGLFYCVWQKLRYTINWKRCCRQTASPIYSKLNEFSRLRLEAMGGFSHAFRAITHNAKTKISAQKSYFVIGVALCGNFCEEEPTAAQIESCAMLLAVLASAYDVPMDAEHIVGHRDLVATACPGDALYARIEEIIGKAIWYCEQ